ncbi:MAG TPA: TIGR00730 family Rossman fold protein [Thermomicrobiales bacterium]|nr:TIGR00730 family Rossman fold protein [Thermomicrobiales bacterium]
MKSVAVFCGSSTGTSPEYVDLARALGREIAGRNLTLVFGGGRVGLMGAVADAALKAGGEVIGVIPQALMDKELGHTGISQLRITGSMHERKALMAQEADGFIALPGGFGTLDEFCEILTWAQLGIHEKPCGLLDTGNGFFRHLRAFFDDAVEAGFVRADHRAMVLEDTDPASLLNRMAAWAPTTTPKWISETPVP